MTLEQFVRMWKRDNSVEDMILVTKRSRGRVFDYLYHVLYINERGGNGRHEAVRVRVNKNNEVLEHNIFNLHGEEWGRKDAELDADNRNNYTVQVTNWFYDWDLNQTGTNYSGGTAGSVSLNYTAVDLAYY